MGQDRNERKGKIKGKDQNERKGRAKRDKRIMGGMKRTMDQRQERKEQ
jgi:hypothetical protein